jgi:hypothetical protein
MFVVSMIFIEIIKRELLQLLFFTGTFCFLDFITNGSYYFLEVDGLQTPTRRSIFSHFLGPDSTKIWSEPSGSKESDIMHQHVHGNIKHPSHKRP